MADKLPENYGKTVAYPWFRQTLTEASKGWSWIWTEVCPDAFVGFTAQGSDPLNGPSLIPPPYSKPSRALTHSAPVTQTGPPAARATSPLTPSDSCFQRAGKSSSLNACRALKEFFVCCRLVLSFRYRIKSAPATRQRLAGAGCYITTTPIASFILLFPLKAPS